MDYNINIIPKDDGVAFNLTTYKPFRLRALKTDPSCKRDITMFIVPNRNPYLSSSVSSPLNPTTTSTQHLTTTSFGSNYAREVAFDDKKWKQRALNPIVSTFVAVANSTSAGNNKTNPIILSAASLIGPIPAPQLAAVSRLHREPQPPVHWEINAVWTAPEARRCGIARHVLNELTGVGKEHAVAQGRDCLMTVAVEPSNAGALALYKRYGYTPISVEGGPPVYQDATWLALFLPLASV
ncbi:hypothetical protein B0H66DRAFT_527659 [Apodospora peruviana]|uniref:N-acetyltransferase domain-containing protein n=1 Tax=Apodospora peruviana TaxID=516989 RepID=A0AAE0IS52_9PEZI|nr:hypothetical protein B0H66DRAFT_527659 [Apodospora peruviana]